MLTVLKQRYTSLEYVRFPFWFKNNSEEVRIGIGKDGRAHVNLAL